MKSKKVAAAFIGAMLGAVALAGYIIAEEKPAPTQAELHSLCINAVGTIDYIINLRDDGIPEDFVAHFVVAEAAQYEHARVLAPMLESQVFLVYRFTMLSRIELKQSWVYHCNRAFVPRAAPKREEPKKLFRL